MTNNETPINGQGLRLVQQSEGIDVPLLQPWEVEGEKEALASYPNYLEAVIKIEQKLKELYEHTQTCTAPDCHLSEDFEKVMAIRRTVLLPLLAIDMHMYEVFYGVLLVYLLAQFNERLFVGAIFAGLELSAVAVKGTIAPLK